MHEIEEEEEEEEKYEPQLEGKLQAWENLLRSQARPVPKCPQESPVDSWQLSTSKVLKALEDFKKANGGQDALALMDQELNELEKNTQKEENEVKDADQKNTQEEKNEVNNTDDKNTQEGKNEVKDTDDKNTQEEKNEVKDSDEKNTQEEKVKAEVKVSEDKKKRVPMDTEDKDDPETCQPRKKAKKTFANRAPPKTEGPYIQWGTYQNLQPMKILTSSNGIARPSQRQRVLKLPLSSVLKCTSLLLWLCPNSGWLSAWRQHRFWSKSVASHSELPDVFDHVASCLITTGKNLVAVLIPFENQGGSISGER